MLWRFLPHLVGFLPCRGLVFHPCRCNRSWRSLRVRGRSRLTIFSRYIQYAVRLNICQPSTIWAASILWASVGGASGRKKPSEIANCSFSLGTGYVSGVCICLQCLQSLIHSIQQAFPRSCQPPFLVYRAGVYLRSRWVGVA